MPRVVLGALVVLVALSGCSDVKENLRPVPLESFVPSGKFDLLWSKPVGKGQDARYARLEPIIDQGVIYTVDVKGRVVATDAENGKRLWKYSVNEAIGGGVGTVDDTLLLGTLQGQVIALSSKDGQELWRANLSSEVVSTPLGDDGVVIAQAIDGRLFALDSTDGSIKWSYDHPVPVLTLRAQAAPVVTDGVAYVAFDNGQLMAFDSETGKLRWSARVGQPKGKTEIERLVDVDTSPVVKGPFVYSAGYHGKVVAVNRGSGRLNWAQNVSTYHNLVVADGKVGVVDEDSHVSVYDAATGSTLWTSDQLHRRDLSAPAIFKNTIVTVDYQGALHALDLETGQFVARTAIASVQVKSQPIVYHETLYILGEDGQMQALNMTPVEAREGATRVSTKLRARPRVRQKAGSKYR